MPPLELPLAGQVFTNEQKWLVSINPTTLSGNPASVEAGSLTVAPVNGDGTVELVDDRSFFVVSGTNPGDTTYVVSADADLGPGVSTLSDTVTIHITGAMAANMGMNAAPSPEQK